MKNEKKKETSLSKIIQSDVAKRRFAEIFGETEFRQKTKTNAFIVSILNILKNNENLAKASRESLLFAAVAAATLDLPVNENLGFSFIVPYRDKNGGYLAQFQIGYKGFIQLAMRSGQFLTISSSPVWDGQILSKDPLRGFEFDFERKVDRKAKVVGYAAYFKLLNGFEKTLFMPVDQILLHAETYSKSFRKGYGLWKDNFDVMATKTVIKLLLSKYAPLSIEMSTAILSDQATGEDQYPDNGRSDLEEIQKKVEFERLENWIGQAESIEKLKVAKDPVKISGDSRLIALYEEKEKRLSL